MNIQELLEDGEEIVFVDKDSVLTWGLRVVSGLPSQKGRVTAASQKLCGAATRVVQHLLAAAALGSSGDRRRERHRAAKVKEEETLQDLQRSLARARTDREAKRMPARPDSSCRAANLGRGAKTR